MIATNPDIFYNVSIAMRHEGQASNIDVFAENAALLMNLPRYDEEVGADESYLQEIFEEYGAEAALRLATLAYIASLALAPQAVYAQDFDNTIDANLPPIEIPDINPIIDFSLNQTANAEVSASGAISPIEFQIDGVEALLDLLRRGLSSEAYEIKFENPDAEILVKQYLRENQLFLSTGNVVTPLNAEIIKQIFGSNFSFLLQNDTQGVQVLFESRKFNATVQDTASIPSETITTTNQTQLEDGLLKTTTTVTDTNGAITKTVQYNNNDWGYIAGKTLSGDLIASGRMLIAGSPYLRLRNYDNPQLFTDVRLYVLYTGGHTTESGLFVPSFEYEPIFNKDTANYHGRVISENIGALTLDVENLVLINADVMTYVDYKNGLSIRLAKALHEANKTLGTNFDFYITESMAGATSRSNGLYKYLQELGIDYHEFIHTFAAAGNDGSLLTIDSVDPDWLAQVVALNPERTALTRYTNYGLNPNLYLGERGDFYAVSPFIDDNGNLIYIPRKYSGTSMATPIAAAQAVVKDRIIISDVAPMPVLFTDVRDIIYGGALNGGVLARGVNSITDQELNNILNGISYNEDFPLDSTILFDANWTSFNGLLEKRGSLNKINMPWEQFVALPRISMLQNQMLPFDVFYRDSFLPQLYASYVGGLNGNSYQKVSAWNTPEAIARVKALNLDPVLIPSLTVEQLTYQLRVGNGVLPNFDTLDKTMFVLNADRIRKNLDPQFYPFIVKGPVQDPGAQPVIDLPYRIFFPMVISEQ